MRGSRDESPEEILFVEFHDGKVHSVETTRSTYDVFYSRRDKCHYFHKSGGGGGPYFNVQKGMTYWLRPDLKVSVSMGKAPWHRKPRKGDDLGTRLPDLPAEYPIAWFLREIGDDTQCVYCPTCEDWIPDHGYGGMCDHVWWCNDRAWYSEPGDRCDDDCEECAARDRPTKGDEYVLGFIGKGYGRVGDDHWHANVGYPERYERPGFYLADEWPMVAIAWGYALAALDHFEAIEEEEEAARREKRWEDMRSEYA